MRRLITGVVARIVLIGFVLWMLSTIGARWLVVNVPRPHSDALLVLAGGRVYRERVLHAAKLFLAGRANVILLTDDGQLGSWSPRLQRNPSSVERALLALERAGVPRDRIRVLPGIVQGTADEARVTREYVATKGFHSVDAVTSPYHTRRTFWILRRLLTPDGIDVGIDPAFSDTTPNPATWWVNREGWQNVGAEFIKLPYYWVRYWRSGPRDD